MISKPGGTNCRGSNSKLAISSGGGGAGDGGNGGVVVDGCKDGGVVDGGGGGGGGVSGLGKDGGAGTGDWSGGGGGGGEVGSGDDADCKSSTGRLNGQIAAGWRELEASSGRGGGLSGWLAGEPPMTRGTKQNLPQAQIRCKILPYGLS